MSKDLSSKIDTYISERPFVMQYLHEEIININALSQKIIQDLNLNNDKTTVSMAIRRLILPTIVDSKTNLNIKDILNESTFTIQNNLVEIRIPKKNFKNEFIDQEEILDIVKSNREIVVVMTKLNAVSFLSKNKEFENITDMNVITLTMPSKYKLTPSIYFLLFKEFSLLGINILSFRTVFDDIKIYLSNEMVDKAYKHLSALCRTSHL